MKPLLTVASKAGRPPKLTLEVQTKIVGAIRAGNWRKVAARWAGIGDTTFKTWMRLGKTQRRGKYRNFRHQVLEAEQAAEIAMVGLVMQAARQDAKHAEWFLERKFHERWGRRDRTATELTGAGGDALHITVMRQASERDDDESPALQLGERKL